jgi:hypothetical protein
LEKYRREFGGRGYFLAVERAKVGEEPQAVVQETATKSDESERNGEAAQKAKQLSQSLGSSLFYSLGWAWSKLMTPQHRTGVLGVNLGKNKLSNDEVGVSSMYCNSTAREIVCH